MSDLSLFPNKDAAVFTATRHDVERHGGARRPCHITHPVYRIEQSVHYVLDSDLLCLHDGTVFCLCMNECLVNQFS